MLSFSLKRKLSLLRHRIRDSRLGRRLDEKRFLKIFFAAFIGIMLLWSGFVFLIDPYVVWHRAWGWPQVYSNTYAMIPGILRHFSYDTVFVGSSLAKNTKISDIDRLLQCHAVKATASGAQSRDAAAFITEALNAGKVRRFVICVDVWSFVREDKTPRYLSYGYLYGKRNILPYLFSLDTLSAAGDFFSACLSPKGSRRADLDKDFDRMFFDPVWRHRYSKQAVIDSICDKRYKDSPHAATPPDEEMENSLFSFIRKNPDIRFDLYLAPISVWQWCSTMDQGDFEKYMAVRKLAAEKTALCHNAVLHDFQAEEKIICNLEIYNDTTHYSPEINSWIVEQIAANPQGCSVEKVVRSSEKLLRLTREALPGFHAVMKQAGRRKEK